MPSLPGAGKEPAVIFLFPEEEVSLHSPESPAAEQGVPVLLPLPPPDPYQPPVPVDLGAVIDQVQAVYGPTDEVVFTVAGSDPWIGTPVAYLELEDGTPVLRPGGQPVDSDGLGFWVELSTDPTYRADMDASERAFHWHVHLFPRPRVIGAHPRLEGRYRLRVEVPVAGGEPMDVISDTFEVSAD